MLTQLSHEPNSIQFNFYKNIFVSKAHIVFSEHLRNHYTEWLSQSSFEICHLKTVYAMNGECQFSLLNLFLNTFQNNRDVFSSNVQWFFSKINCVYILCMHTYVYVMR